MRKLIDADIFLQNLINCDIGRKSLEKVIEAVKKQPTAYDPDKVVEQLEDRSEEYNSGVRLHGKPEEMLTDDRDCERRWSRCRLNRFYSTNKLAPKW